MARGVVVVCLVAAVLTSDVHHCQQHDGCNGVHETIVDHGWNGKGSASAAVSTRYHLAPPWSTLVEPNPGPPASACVQRVELTPDQVPKRVVHVVKACVLVRFAFVAVALQLQAFDDTLAVLRYL